MGVREARQRCTLNGCYLRSNVDGTWSVGKHEWDLRMRPVLEYTCDCLETLVIKSGRL